MTGTIPAIDETDRRIIAATQEGLPLVPRPYHHLAKTLGISGEEVQSRMQRMLDTGVIRRLGAVPNHYALGLGANGMSVWDVDDDAAYLLGKEIGALGFVSHCYLRPRHLPLWRYNLFAMVHGSARSEVEEKAATIAEMLGPECRARDILYSTRILKKTGLRIATPKEMTNVPT
jgi:DNA-binding Lrp family transcriptional regulator